MHTVEKTIVVLTLLVINAFAKDIAPAPPDPAPTVHEVRYDGKLADNEGRFTVDLDIESTGKNEVSLPLFTGDIAVPETKLPDGLRLSRETNQYRLVITKAGRYKLTLDLVARVTRADPWNQVSFEGPVAVIASINAQATGAGIELQLLSGTSLELEPKDPTHVRGFLGASRTVSLRWQSKAVEMTRKAVLTCDTAVTAQINPTVIRYTTQLRYEILQGAAPKLTVTLPATQALTKLQGEGVRDWQVKPEADQQILTVEFLKPVEKNYSLTLFSEQTIESATASIAVGPPQPQEVERESGSITISAEDVLVETETLAGVRQVNAPAGAIAAYQFYGRPFTLGLKLRRIEPVVNVASRVTARLEESRLVVSHALTLNVEKAGVYAIELAPLGGLVVADVRGDSVSDWKVNDGKISVTFSSRVLGSRKLDIQLEQALKTFPDKLTIAPLRVAGAVKETAQIGAASAAGIRLKTGELSGAREIPITALGARSDELLAYTTDQPDWNITLTTERLSSRVVAEIFNLVTVGDGLVGGSATIRYGIVNQGVQEFRIRVPLDWKNVDFTGANIRRKEEKKDDTGSTWTVTLQDKAWGGYTLVVTYDYQFNPRQALLPMGGAHALDVERETGTVAITTAASLQIKEAKVAAGGGSAIQAAGAAAGATTMHRIDESELGDNDRALITRPVLLAYLYEGPAYDLQVNVTRYEDADVLAAVADRTQLTTVVTEQGQVLSQASYMVKNNDKQYQTFTLPAGADFWSCYVNGQPAKPERSGGKLLVPLPRGVNRDQAVPVDIVYAQKIGSLKSLSPRAIALAAPKTDVQTTYAEWELFVPLTHRLSGFGGNMTVARGTTYGLRDAWRQFLRFYDELYSFAGPFLVAAVVAIGGLIALVFLAFRRGWRGVLALGGGVVATLILLAMLMPAMHSVSMRERALSNQAVIVSPSAQFTDTEEAAREAGNDMGGADTLEGASKIRAENALVAHGSSAANGKPAAPPTAVQPAPPVVVATGGLVTQAGAAMLLPGGGAVMPVVAGIRPIQIEIPRTGQRFVFTKVLNVRDEPLAVQSVATQIKVFNAVRATIQVVAFLGGLVLLWWQLRRANPGSLLVTLAVALLVVSVVSVLLAARLMHVGLILLPPFVVIAGLVWLARQMWKRRQKKSSVTTGPSSGETPSPGGSPTTPPIIAAIAFLLFGATQVNAADQPSNIQAARTAVAVTNAPAVIAKTGSVSVLSAAYVATVRERVAEIEATFVVNSSDPNQTLKLFGEDVAVQSFAGSQESRGWSLFRSSNAAKLVRDGASVSVQLPNAGPATLKLKYLVKLGGDPTSGGKRLLGFAILPALVSNVSVTINEPDAVVEFPAAVSFKTTTENQQTRVAAIIGAGDRVDLSWTPRVKRAAEIAATVFCQNTSLASIGNGVLNVRSAMDFQVTQGELRQMRVRLPAGQRLMRVEGETIRTWAVKTEDGAQILAVELIKGVSPSYRLTLETEKPMATTATGAAPAPQLIETPHALDVKRESGLIALKAGEEVGLSVETATGLQKVDVTEYARPGSGVSPDGISSVFRFLKPDFDLRLLVQSMQPQIEAVVQNRINVGTEQINISGTVNYTIKRAGVFVLKVALPAGYRIENVTGPNIGQWVETAGGDSRTLEVTLKEKTLGTYSLRVDLVKVVKELAKTVEIVGVHPLGAQKLTGFIAVTAEAGVQLKTDALDKLTEVPAAMVLTDVPATGGVLAYKFIAGDQPAQPGWKLTVATEVVEAWVRAETMQWLTLTDTLVSGRALVRYEIQNSPVKQFRVRVPAGFTNVELNGLNIRTRDHEGDVWRVELQNKVRGTYTLTVTWNQPWDVKNGSLNVEGVSIEGVERETGALAIIAKPPLRVEKKAASEDLLPLDVQELPEWAGRSEQTPTLAYRYLRTGFKLELTAQRFEEAEVLQALVDNVRLTTVVADDGQMMTEMAVDVRNNARQYLAITLPEKTEVWSAFVAGQPVRPTKRDGKVLLPMQRSGGDGAPVSIQLTYVGTTGFPRRRGDVMLASPALDVPVKNAQWELYLPPDYRYGGFAGTMAHAAGVTPVYQGYTLSDYTRGEESKNKSIIAETVSSLRRARGELAKGNLKDASWAYNSALPNASSYSKEQGQQASDEFKQLESDLKRAQALNVIEGQRRFQSRANNDSQSSPQQAASQSTQQFDNQVAEQQWAKLQKAQEVGVVKVLPLRVSLPTHGIHHAFSQVLQTEIEKPMTIQFSALNTKSVSWPVWIGLCAGGFVLLWVTVAGVMMRRRIIA